jgi:diguanylate cyclase (GGDEF)-like protein
VIWGAAALHPSMRSMSEVAPDRAVRFSHRRLALLATTSLMAPAVLVEQGLRHQPIDVGAIAIGSVVLFLLVVLRMSGLVAQVQDQAAQLAALAHNDMLTGIPNRRAWELELPRDMARVRRHGGRLCVALLDLDHFKRFNDQYGHQGGDRLLKEATAAWRTRIRSTDLLARYGGEEFAVLLRDCGPGEAIQVLGDLRAATPLGQSFSAGVAEWDGQESPERLVGRADVGLYEAKRAGRDRVIVTASQAAATTPPIAPPPRQRLSRARSTPTPAKVGSSAPSSHFTLQLVPERKTALKTGAPGLPGRRRRGDRVGGRPGRERREGAGLFRKPGSPDPVMEWAVLGRRALEHGRS